MCLYIQYNPFAISSGSRQYLSFPSTSEALASRRYDSCHMRQRSVDLVDINRKIRSKHHETGVEILGAQLIVQNSQDLRWALLNWKSLPLSGPTLHSPKNHGCFKMLIFMKHVTSPFTFNSWIEWNFGVMRSKHPNESPTTSPFCQLHLEATTTSQWWWKALTATWSGSFLGQWWSVVSCNISQTFEYPKKGSWGDVPLRNYMSSICQTQAERSQWGT